MGKLIKLIKNLTHNLSMKYLAAYALLVLGGNENPTYEDVGKMLKEVGVAVDKEKLITMMDKLADKDFATLVKEGKMKLSDMGTLPRLLLPLLQSRSPSLQRKRRKQRRTSLTMTSMEFHSLARMTTTEPMVGTIAHTNVK